MRTSAWIFTGLIFLTGLVPGWSAGQSEGPAPSPVVIPEDPNIIAEKTPENRKFVIYQMMTRLFGNRNGTNKSFGTMEENGVGKLADITTTALQALKRLGADYVWYTGILEHATMDDYTAAGIPLDDSDVIKGRAGSPYAIKDYYDVNPQLAIDPARRRAEFDELVARTHEAGLKVLIDFVPNHVARSYGSDAKPQGVVDLGQNDDKTVGFAPGNNFYYIVGKPFRIPKYDPLGPELKGPQEDGLFAEDPAKATGNDRFVDKPSKDDWFETVKLNYGVNAFKGNAKHFDPAPDTWIKMKDILVFWAQKKIDGFRCDMAEMVPVEFWAWAIPQVKAVNPQIIFVAEIYNPQAYENYVDVGRFDYLYDKVGLYDTVRPLTKGAGNPAKISESWRKLPVPDWSMLRFLENHDEQRIASSAFAGSGAKGFGAYQLSVTLGTGPAMIYFGQEVGEPGAGKEGFQGEDGRTTIFDYWGVSAHQRWMNQGAFDGGQLSTEEKDLRTRYETLLNFIKKSSAVSQGRFYDLDWANRGLTEGYSPRMYAYLRYSPDQKLLFVYSFDQTNALKARLRIPQAAFAALGLDPAKTYELSPVQGLDSGVAGLTVKGSAISDLSDPKAGFTLDLAPAAAPVFEIKTVE